MIGCAKSCVVDLALLNLANINPRREPALYKRSDCLIVTSSISDVGNINRFFAVTSMKWNFALSCVCDSATHQATHQVARRDQNAEKMEKELAKIKQLNFLKLYGAERNKLRDRCKKLSTQDGVGDALHSGESDADGSKWITSTKYFHKVAIYYNYRITDFQCFHSYISSF